jgi:predicted nucleic acid-binding protein
MTLIIDAAPLVALADPDDPMRDAVRACLEAEPGELVIAAPVTAEIDYLLGKLVGRAARLAFIADVAAGRFKIASLDAAEHARALSIEERYGDLDLGLADCATIVLAARFGTLRVLTFDHRHFRAVTPLQGGVFEMLPADT